MPVDLITKDHYKELQCIFSQIETSIDIVSPFITVPLAKELCSAIKKRPEVQCRIVTRFYRRDFVQEVSHVKALKMLIESGAQIFALIGLHAKLYLVDRHTALIGSANMTFGGFHSNHELSLLIRKEPRLIKDICDYADTLVKDIGKEDCKVSLAKIKDEENRVAEYCKDQKASDSNLSYKYGADLYNSVSEHPFSKTDMVQSILQKDNVSHEKNTIWLKLEGSAKERIDPLKRHDILVTEDYLGGITCFLPQRKPSSIKFGDYIYIAAVSTDRNGNNTCIIIGRARTYGFVGNNIANDKMLEAHPWMKKYKVFIELYDTEWLDTEVQNGILLHDLLKAVGDHTYPSTYNSGKNEKELGLSHRNQSHLRITAEAKEYLDACFNRLVAKYGRITADI